MGFLRNTGSVMAQRRKEEEKKEKWMVKGNYPAQNDEPSRRDVRREVSRVGEDQGVSEEIVLRRQGA